MDASIYRCTAFQNRVTRVYGHWNFMIVSEISFYLWWWWFGGSICPLSYTQAISLPPHSHLVSLTLILNVCYLFFCSISTSPPPPPPPPPPPSYAFALEENNERRRAEELARRVLAMDPSASWGYHTLCENP